MSITMYQSDRNTVSPANDASLFSGIVNDTNGTLNRGTQFAVTVNGLVATVGTGQAVIQGRLVEITQSETLTLPANSSGTIAIAVDLTKTNDVIGSAGTANYAVNVNQVYLVAVTGTLTQDDLNNGGFLYELPIASFTSTTTSATVTVIKSIFNDTGWLDLPHSPQVRFNTIYSFLKYRVKNGVVYVRWRELNVLNTTNGNQIGTLPATYRPYSEFSTVSYGDNNYLLSTHINNTGTLWVGYPDNNGNKGGNTISGYISYPLG